MTDLLFSVVIPCYNYAHTVRRAVESVLRQPGTDYELLVVNDGSTDDTEHLLVKLVLEYDGRFRVVTRANSGLAATRNFGIDNTNGQYLLFLDADDAFCDDALYLIRQCIIDNPGLCLAVGGYINVSPCGNKKLIQSMPIPKLPIERVKQFLLSGKLRLSNGSVAMNRDVFARYRYPEKFKSSEDLAMFAFVLANYSVVGFDGAVTFVYKHSDSLRHNAALAKSVGLQVVDEVFDPMRLPGKFQTLKGQFTTERLLSISRICFLSGDKYACRAYYCQAFKRDWRVVSRLNYTRKFLKSFF